MKYATLKKAARRRIQTAALAAGLCSPGEPSLPTDRLTEASNLWWYRGALRTRPGLTAQGGRRLCESWQRPLSLVHFPLHRGDDRFVLTVTDDDDPDVYVHEYQIYRLPGEGGAPQPMGDLFTLTHEDRRVLPVLPPPVEDDPAELYLLCDSIDGAEMLVKRPGKSAWKPAKGTVPTLWVNGRGRGVHETREGRNLLSGGFTCGFTTGGIRCFYLPHKNWTVKADQPVSATYVDAEGNDYTWSVSAEGETLSDSHILEGRAVRMKLTPSRGYISFEREGDDGFEDWVLPATEMENNLTVTAYVTNYVPSRRVSGMTLSAWFGGTEGRRRTGTRLFLAGHPDYPGMLRWSARDNPLSFSEHHYAYVGEPGEAITALHRQGNRLVIFKEHSVYAMTYRANAVAEDEGAAEPEAAPFPVTQLHPAVGCDRPHTVSLWGDSLLWVSGGRVWTLPPSGVPHSVGEPVEHRLGDGALSATAWAEGYALLTDRHLLVAVGTPAEPVWYQWDVTLPGVTWHHVTEQGGRLCLWGDYRTDDGQHLVFYHLSGIDDQHLTALDADGTPTVSLHPVESRFLTAGSCLGYPERHKTVEALWVPASGPGTLTLWGVTDRGETAPVTVTPHEDGLVPQALPVPAGGVRRLGVGGICRGEVSLGNPLLYYTLR